MAAKQSPQDRMSADRCAVYLKALGEPLRLRIVDVLRDGPRNVGDLAEALGVEVITVSHHLGILKNAGLVEREKRGRFGIYRLTPGMLQPRSLASGNERLDLGCCRIELPTVSPGDAPS